MKSVFCPAELGSCISKVTAFTLTCSCGDMQFAQTTAAEHYTIFTQQRYCGISPNSLTFKWSASTECHRLFWGCACARVCFIRLLAFQRPVLMRNIWRCFIYYSVLYLLFNAPTFCLSIINCLQFILNASLCCTAVRTHNKSTRTALKKWKLHGNLNMWDIYDYTDFSFTVVLSHGQPIKFVEMQTSEAVLRSRRGHRA